MDNNLKTLKQQQWDTMRSILDRELPENEKRKSPLFLLYWILGILLISIGLWGVRQIHDTNMRKSSTEQINIVSSNDDNIPTTDKSNLAEKINANRVAETVESNKDEEIATKSGISHASNSTTKNNNQDYALTHVENTIPQNQYEPQDVVPKVVNYGSKIETVKENATSFVNLNTSLESLPTLTSKVYTDVTTPSMYNLVQHEPISNIKNSNRNVFIFSVLHSFDLSNTINLNNLFIQYEYLNSQKWQLQAGLGYTRILQGNTMYYLRSYISNNFESFAPTMPSASNTDSSSGIVVKNQDTIVISTQKAHYVSVNHRISRHWNNKLSMGLTYELSRYIGDNWSSFRSVDNSTISAKLVSNYPKWLHVVHLDLDYNFYKTLSVYANINQKINWNFQKNVLDASALPDVSQNSEPKQVNTLVGVGLRYRF